MKAKICDRCGSFYNIDTERCREFFVMKENPGKKYRSRIALDLCDGCLKDLKGWMEDGNKASNYKPDRPDAKV